MIRDKEELKLFSFATLLEILQRREGESRFTDHRGEFSSKDIKQELKKRNDKGENYEEL
jgi:hypothetical protein